MKNWLVGCIVLASQAAMAADEAPFGLRITWKSKDGTVEWSTLWFESAARRTKEVEEYQRDYGPGGLLEFADRKPIDFKAITKGVSGRIEQPEKAVPGEKPGVKPGVTKPAPKPNKKWLIWLEEPRNGRWTKTAENEFTDQRAFYDAYIKAVKSVDDRNRAAGRTIVTIRWREIEVPKIEKPDLPFVDAKRIDQPIVGRWEKKWEPSPGTRYHSVVLILPDGVARWETTIVEDLGGSVNRFSSTGRWSLNGEDVLFEEASNEGYNGKPNPPFRMKQQQFGGEWSKVSDR